jgi:nucleotide-binding universal stress UspA family protein
MFNKILVPLDGSGLSEVSLAAAAAIAERFGSSITLFHAIERDAPGEVHRDRHLTTFPEAEAYLGEIVRRAFAPHLALNTHVHAQPTSDVAASIVRHAQAEIHADLIVTCTHGNSGVRDLLFGSIAQRVVAQGQLPLLLIRPDNARFEPRSMLVPLDPDSMHDVSLEPAATFAGAFRATIQLLSVIHTIGTLPGEEAATTSLMPITAMHVLDLREQEAAAHLSEHRGILEKRGLQVEDFISRGDPATQIVRFAEQPGSDLIILSTHRRAGLQAFWSKSVAPRVAQSTRKPLLLLPLS